MTETEFKQIIALKHDGKLFKRENTTLEFKANFNTNDLPVYAKTFCAFANHSGGTMVFGVTDSPRLPKGMTNSNFSNIEIEKVTNYLNEHYSPEIGWNTFEFQLEDRKFGVIQISESSNKPVICKKNTHKDASKEGDIFYRYSGRSEKIKYPELVAILNASRELEQRKWMEHIQNIAKIGPTNVALMDVYRGSIHDIDGKQIIIDPQLLNDIKFVREGHFVEEEGAPTLKLIGSIEGKEGLTTIIPNLDLNNDFFTTKELGEQLGLLSERGSTVYVDLPSI